MNSTVPPRPTRGFSLLELLVVLTLVGLLVTASASNLATPLNNWKRRSAVRMFESTHALTKATALRYGRVAQMHIDAATARFWIEVDTSLAQSGVTDTIGAVRDVYVTGLTMTSTRSLLCFDTQGLPTIAGSCGMGDARVTFALQGHVDTVTTTGLGRLLR